MEEETTDAGRSWRRWLILLGAVVVVVLAAGVGVVVTRPHHRRPTLADAAAVAAGYLRAWEARNWPVMAAVVDRPPVDFGERHQAVLSALSATSATYSPGATTAVGGVSTAFTARLTLAGLGTWEYEGRIPMTLVRNHWMIEWTPAVIEPDLGTSAGAVLTRTRALPQRGDLLAADGTPLGRLAGAASLVGTVGTIGAAGPKPTGLELAGDTVGTSGLQEAFNGDLMGEPSGDVMLGSRSLHHFPGQPGASVRTTIDPADEAVADRVLHPLTKLAALVALDAPTGNILAVVSHPDGGYQRALIGTYPAGSTFKVVTATAALTAGATSTTPVSCPPNVTVDGRTFGNAEHEQYGTIPFEEAFAKSCNTAFINVAKTLSDTELDQAAASLGIGTGWPFPLPHFTGQLPKAVSPVEHVSDAIGQGRVEVSPLGMAAVAAAVDSGAFHAPQLVAPASPPPGTPLPATVVPTLREFMRAVVTSGTGTAANVAGDPVFGKTGTAEFGTATPPHTHAWFIGYRDNVAFAVIVEDGGFGGDVAAPLAARFLSGIA